MIVQNYSIVRGDTEKADREIADGVAVACDGCKGNLAWLRFNSEGEASDWIDGKDYMLFGGPVCADIYHRIGSKIYCSRCTEKLIQETKGVYA